MEKVEIIISIIVVIIAIVFALFIGKTSIVDGAIYIERPFTAILTFCVILAGYFNL